MPERPLDHGHSGSLGLKRPMRLADVPLRAEVATSRDWCGPAGLGIVIAKGPETAGYRDGGGVDDVAVRRRDGGIYCYRYWQVEVLDA